MGEYHAVELARVKERYEADLAILSAEIAALQGVLATALARQETLASKTHRRAISAYWVLSCGVCLQQAIANQGLPEVDQCNLVTYVFAYATLLNLEQRSGEPAAQVPQRRKKAKNCHVWGLSRETTTKLVMLCFSLAQFLFTGDTVRASALGTNNQEHFHGALRRMLHGDNRGSALCGNWTALPDWAGVPGILPEDEVLMRAGLRRFLLPPLYVDNLVGLPVGPPKWWVTTSDSRIGPRAEWPRCGYRPAVNRLAPLG
jgi:hypothetical protein